MNKTLWSLTPFIALSACNITPQQGFQGLQDVDSLIFDDNDIQQSKRLCSQQNEPVLRLQCEQQAQREFQKYQLDQRRKNDE